VPATGNKSKKALLAEYLKEENLSQVSEREWREIVARLAPVSESYLRRLLADTPIPVDQPFAGVRQKTFDELEGSLVAMGEVYIRSKETGDRARERQCRNAVIQAKDHARFAARSPKVSPDKKAQKEEMIQWMLVWLDDPGVFPAWVKLRKQKM
jgi:hypothetical protein